MMYKKRRISVLLVLSMLIFLSSFDVCAAELIANKEGVDENVPQKTIGKIDSELQKVMDEAEEDELIPVWVWRKSIQSNVIDQMLLNETGMDSTVYKDENRFNKEILPEIEARIEKELGYKAAHKVVERKVKSDLVPESLFEINQNNIISAYEVTPIDTAVSEEYDKYITGRRTIVKREYSRLNDEFIKENNIDVKDNIIYNSRYSSTLIVKATKDEIVKYAASDMVELISLYVEEFPQNELDVSLEQVGVYCQGGTGYTQTNGWVAYDGFGIKVGIIESENGRYDSTSPQLSGNSRLQFIDNVGDDGKIVDSKVSDHATMVTSIIAGQTQIVNHRNFTGVVPFATVYQMPAVSMSDALAGMQQLIDKGVTVINYSAGVPYGMEYKLFDGEADRIIANSGVVFVKSAGNQGGDITSPGKAVNAITVGNVASKIESDAAPSPFSMNFSSAFMEESYLPNKPDISAPGTNIGYVKKEGECVFKTGTSYSAPIVAGIVAQMMQAKSSLKGDPTMVKAALLQGAESSKINTKNDVSVGNGLRDKSGAGFVNSINAVKNSFGTKKISLGNIQPNTITITKNFYFSAGQKIRAVMVFDKQNDRIISSVADLDDIDFYLRKGSIGENVASSTSSRNNVEIIEYTIEEEGWYAFGVKPYRIVDEEKLPNVSIVFGVK